MEKPTAKQGATTKAVIYCRVSSHRQTVDGHGLGSQETRCREYAERRGYEVIEVYHDEASGSQLVRPAMQDLISFLKKQKDPHIVIFDDLNRLAREVVVHWMLKWEIEKAGGILEALNHPFGKDSDAILVENMLASVSHYHRQKNAEQALNRMRSRLLNGFWPFKAPVGYRHEKRSGFGKVLVRDEPLATIVQTAGHPQEPDGLSAIGCNGDTGCGAWAGSERSGACLIDLGQTHPMARRRSWKTRRAKL